MTRLPSVPGSRTSAAAAESAAPRAPSLRARVLYVIQRSGVVGMTDDELFTRFPGYNQSSIRPRRIELEALGQIVKTTRERPTRSGRMAAVYVAREYATSQLSLLLVPR